jgi:hypothetical protein
MEDVSLPSAYVQLAYISVYRAARAGRVLHARNRKAAGSLRTLLLDSCSVTPLAPHS